MRILGLDPGSRATGYGLIESQRRVSQLVECGVVRPKKGDLSSRLLHIYEGILALIDRLEPTDVAIETAFSGRNIRSSMILGHARGVLMLAAAQRDLPVHEYSPREVKKYVVGAGGATKAQVGFMVQRQLNLAKVPAPEDAADGCAVALSHALSRMPGFGRVPAVLSS